MASTLRLRPLALSGHILLVIIVQRVDRRIFLRTTGFKQGAYLCNQLSDHEVRLNAGTGIAATQLSCHMGPVAMAGSNIKIAFRVSRSTAIDIESDVLGATCLSH
jgi:hypothetical protein